MIEELHVSCAIIEGGGLVLAAQRSAHMALPGKWEFPGGKIEKYESPAAALRREIQEELGVDIELMQELPPHPFPHKPGLQLVLWPFIARLHSDRIRLKEHQQVRWCSSEELQQLDWAPADWPVLRSYLQLARIA